MSMVKLLPNSVLQDDYLELVAYLKEKIQDIKNNNEISFIYAEPGN